jgi:hypothetical protein
MRNNTRPQTLPTAETRRKVVPTFNSKHHGRLGENHINNLSHRSAMHLSPKPLVYPCPNDQQ